MSALRSRLMPAVCSFIQAGVFLLALLAVARLAVAESARGDTGGAAGPSVKKERSASRPSASRPSRPSSRPFATKGRSPTSRPTRRGAAEDEGGSAGKKTEQPDLSPRVREELGRKLAALSLKRSQLGKGPGVRMMVAGGGLTVVSLFLYAYGFSVLAADDAPRWMPKEMEWVPLTVGLGMLIPSGLMFGFGLRDVISTEVRRNELGREISDLRRRLGISAPTGGLPGTSRAMPGGRFRFGRASKRPFVLSLRLLRVGF